MNIVFSPTAMADQKHLKELEPKAAAKLKELLKNITLTPFAGLGKPEPLKHGLSGFWSRRITNEHRLVYKIEGDTIYVASCRHHY
jgi:toxin YoeB